ncbi:phage terminase large subunit family protein [Thiothrix eikelboomii]|uniref:phage terminase large subunit family protein n=1 Tax=Thiothrix eikelboomii TaxID=92487 RepID=UPI00228580F3|nr:phage terminase large subunit family protein [Thiothrix eikelboomii]
MLSEKSSPEPGMWKTSRVPFMREIMLDLSCTSDVQEVTLMKATQIGGTEVGNNFVGYTIDHNPGPTMVVQPTLEMAKRYSRQRIAPMVRDMAVLSEKIAPERSRDSGNTMLEKDFIGGYLVITGANSATGLRSMPVANLLLDEVDAYPFDLDGEGDPEQLAIKRTQNFARKKIFRVSTPTVDGLSRVKRAFLKGDQRYYHVPCPHCGTEQPLVWANIRWGKNLPREEQPSSVYYQCGDCQQAIAEHHKPAMLSAGRWVAHHPKSPKHRRSYHLNSLYSPLGWYSWVQAVQDWLDAQSDVELLKTFTNTVLAETWKEQVNDVNATLLQTKADAYGRSIIPAGGLVLVGAVDVQDNRLEAYVYAFGRGEEQWLIDYEVFLGDPGVSADDSEKRDSPWREVDDWLLKPWVHASGAVLTVEAYAVDTGGHHTHDAYHYVRNHVHHGAVAVKGESRKNRPILGRPSWQDIDWRGKTTKQGVQLYLVGTDTAKDMLYNRFQRTDRSGAGVIHFPDWLPLEVFEQLTSEKKVRRYRHGFAVYDWIKSSSTRNEALDCLVYIQCIAQKIGLHRYSNQRWDALEQGLSVVDLFATAHPVQSVSARMPSAKKTDNTFTEVQAAW